MLVALIMAGGKGTRLYPASREARPKQLLPVFSDQTMVQETFARVRDLTSPDRIFVGTTADLLGEIQAQLPEVPAANYIIEPVGRDTAPAIALGTLVIRQRFPEAVVAVLSADQFIRPTERFHAVLQTAVDAATTTHGLVTIGIRPTRPETAYGYIKPGPGNGPIRRVDRYTEKPDLPTAARFLADGYLWNSGMFVWEVSAICEALARFVPDIYSPLLEVAAGARSAADAFSSLRRISIDFGVMEKASNVYVVEADFVWDDVGSWSSLARVLDADPHGNVARGDFLAIESTGCIVHTDAGLVAAIGVENLVIVRSDDVVLVCPKGRDQEVKRLVERLKSDAERRKYA